MAPQFMMTWWGVLDDLVERPRYRGVMCWMMGVSSAMSLWVVLDDLVEHSRCRSGSCWMRAGGNAGTVVCNSAFLHTARLKTAAPCAIPRFFTHRKTRKRRSVCNSAFLHTARPVTRRRLGIRQAFRRPEMPFSTAFSLCIAAERLFPTFAKSKSVFLKQTYRENNLS